MAAYVLSDIHGQYNLFTDVLNKINLKDSDTLYVLGDVLDRGDNPIKVLQGHHQVLPPEPHLSWSEGLGPQGRP